MFKSIEFCNSNNKKKQLHICPLSGSGINVDYLSPPLWERCLLRNQFTYSKKRVDWQVTQMCFWYEKLVKLLYRTLLKYTINIILSNKFNLQ